MHPTQPQTLPLTPSRSRPLRRRALLALSTVLLGACAAAVLAAPASAHDELVSTSPADGAKVAEVPPAVTLTFGEEVVKLGTAVVVTDSAGRTVSSDKPEVEGSVVTQALAPDLTPGEVTVSYRVVSADGHPVSGSFAFVVAGTASTPASSASATATASDLPASTGPSPLAGDASSSPSDTGSVLPWVLGAGAALLLGAAAVAASRGRGGGSEA